MEGRCQEQRLFQYQLTAHNRTHIMMMIILICDHHNDDAVKNNDNEREGDNDETLAWGRDLIILFFPQKCLQTFFIFLSRAPRSPIFGKELKEK